MKKLWKKLLAVTTAVMMAITLLPAMANASTASDKATIKDNFDLEQAGSITIHKTSQDENDPLEGAGFTLYKLVSFKEKNGTIVVDESKSITNDALKGNINLLDFKTILAASIPEDAASAKEEYESNEKVE